ncbi:LPD29 domain-containing protein [Pseudomonas syringae group genomosp. 3]|uniref:LPD29 domain-containing protein n=1 Tax=Pseudomonas syringae group genomosp. 3 TaxID=251701 RepID=UPI000AEDA7C1|nr:LPD29 domain-containing protein [Pseudomonas syringae group genomosp. 3]
MTICMKLFQVGTRVSCSLPYAGEGIVFDIHGAQLPESVQSLLGVGVSGGNARLDVVFLNGAVSRDCSEALVRASVQWSILDEVASEAEIQAALDHAEAEKVRREAEAKAKADQFVAEVERLKKAPEFAHLEQAEKSAGLSRAVGLLAATNIRKVLKAAFPAVKFSVRKEGYGSLVIEWADGPTVEDVQEVTSKFKGGSFCGSEDIYNHHRTPWNTVFGAADYISERRNHSASFTDRVISELFAEPTPMLEGIEQPTVDQFTSGSLYTVQLPDTTDTLQQLIRQTLYRTRG